MGLTQDIGRFAAAMADAALDDEIAAIVRLGVTDCVAVLVGGWSNPASRIVREVSGASWAAIYGTAAHVLDYDDTAFGTHPSAVLVPALLAAAREAPVTGRALIAAYAAGYEGWAELASRERDTLHDKGWHPTAVLGPVGAAAAVSAAWRLTEPEATTAVAIAASLSGGVVANFGSMTKPFQVGRAAESGLLAARLARAGLTAASDAVEHRLGLLGALSPRGAVDPAPAPALDALRGLRRFGLNIKLSPVCYAAHRTIDAVRDLRDRHAIDPAAIRHIAAEIGSTQSAIVRSRLPRTVEEAKFSLEFAIAATLLTGGCDEEQLAPAFIGRPDVQALAERVERIAIAERDAAEPAHSPFDRVALELADGTRLVSRPITHPHGHFPNPASPARLRAKFDRLVVPVIGAAEADRLFDRLGRLEQAPDAAALLPELP